MRSLGRPAAAYRMILARSTSRYDDVYFRATPSSSRRSALLSSMTNGLCLGTSPHLHQVQRIPLRGCKYPHQIRHRIYEEEHLGCRLAVDHPRYAEPID